MKLENEIKRYSTLNGYPISNFDQLVCSCGESKFKLFSDDEEGGACGVCIACGTEYDVENSVSYIESRQQNICNCDNEILELGVGRALYREGPDVCWVYVGAECKKCGLAGVYVDWKEA